MLVILVANLCLTIRERREGKGDRRRGGEKTGRKERMRAIEERRKSAEEGKRRERKEPAVWWGAEALTSEKL